MRAAAGFSYRSEELPKLQPQLRLFSAAVRLCPNHSNRWIATIFFWADCWRRQTMQVSLNLDVLGIEKLAWLRSNRYDPCHSNRTFKLVDSATSSTKSVIDFWKQKTSTAITLRRPLRRRVWCIDGLGLPQNVFRKIYHENAVRLVEIELKL